MTKKPRNPKRIRKGKHQGSLQFCQNSPVRNRSERGCHRTKEESETTTWPKGGQKQNQKIHLARGVRLCEPVLKKFRKNNVAHCLSLIGLPSIRGGQVARCLSSGIARTTKRTRRRKETGKKPKGGGGCAVTSSCRRACSSP